MKNKVTMAIVSAMLISTGAMAANYKENSKTKTANFAEGTLVVDKPATIEITMKLLIHGNGAEEWPTSSSAIYVNNKECASRDFGWHNGAGSYALSCTVVFKPGTYKIVGKELRNQRATADAVLLTATEIGADGDDFTIVSQ
ncbi:hypothetical protein PX699_00230 [Sphingobium sp. H39-3-25]|uniref:hypothetical protein n=1 Tax=Sphingobium arseniciresistens TaxID=3030834 RepID=UPI0023BA2E2C|nr:hypothetical protein [Sphingobium arseniciresistens]